MSREKSDAKKRKTAHQLKSAETTDSTLQRDSTSKKSVASSLSTLKKPGKSLAEDFGSLRSETREAFAAAVASKFSELRDLTILHQNQTLKVEKQIDSPDKSGWHPEGSAPPDEYKYGPLEGPKAYLAKWIIKDNSVHETLQGILKRGAYWGRKNSDNHFSVWFKNERRFEEAKAKKDRAPRPTKKRKSR